MFVNVSVAITVPLHAGGKGCKPEVLACNGREAGTVRTEDCHALVMLRIYFPLFTQCFRLVLGEDFKQQFFGIRQGSYPGISFSGSFSRVLHCPH